MRHSNTISSIAHHATGPICILGLVAASFANTVPALILTQGIMYGAGFITFYYSILSMVNEYWIARRGMAYGFLCSASGASGAAMPFIVSTLLHKYGYRTTLRCIAVGLTLSTGPFIPILKGRLPESATSTPTPTDWSFLRTPLFWIYSLSNLAMGFGYFFPPLYLPSYATATGLSPTKGALLLALMSISQVLGQFSFGYLSDKRISINLLSATATLVAGIAAYTTWGLASTFSLLVVFALIYGFFGAGYTAMWARMGTAVSSEPTAAFAAFGLLNFGKGIGNVLAGPIGGALLTSGVDVEDYGVMKYQKVILFTGSCMLFSAAVIPAQYLKRARLQLGVRR